MSSLEIVDEPICTPRPGGQEAFVNDSTNFMVALEGGWFAGKTYAGARKLLSLHLYNAFSPPDDRGVEHATYVPSAVVAPTFANANDFDVPEVQDAASEIGLKFKWHGPGPISSGRMSGPALIFPDLGTRARPSVIIFRTADAADRITGWQVGAAWGDEAARWKEDRQDPKHDSFLQLTARVRHPAAKFCQLMFTYTNEGDATRVYEEMTNGKPGRALYRAATASNPTAVDSGFLERQKAFLTPELAKQYLGGGAVSVRGGKVFPTFSSTENVDESLTITEGRPLQATFDFNIAPGMHVEIGQHFPEIDLFTTVHEIHAPRLSVKGVVGYLAKIVESLGGWQNDKGIDRWPVLEVFGDATGGSEWAGTGESCYSVLRQGLDRLGWPYKIRVPSVNPRVVDGVNAVEIAFSDMGGDVHYRIHPRCIRLIEDYHSLKFNNVGEIDTRIRKLSHASDAERYRIHYLRPTRALDDDVVGGRMSV